MTTLSFVTPPVDALGPEGAIASALARNVEPFEAQVLGYNAVFLSWTPPALGVWLGIKIVRSRSGSPRSPEDGVEVLSFEQPGWNEQSAVSVPDLVGGYHYFSLFLRNGFGWQRVSRVDALVPYDYSSTDRMWDNIPEFYKAVRDDTADLSLVNLRINADMYDGIAGGSKPNLLLSAFISLFGWGFDLLRTQVEYLANGYDPSLIHTSRLTLLSRQFGHEPEVAVPAHTNRTIVRNLSSLYRVRGTLAGIKDTITAVSGWDVEVSIGQNMMLSEEQAAFANPTSTLVWSPSKSYTTTVVKYGDYMYKSLLPNVLSTPPTGTQSSNASWEYTDYPRELSQSNPTTTGDVSTWQVRLSGAGGTTVPISGYTRLAVGALNTSGVKRHTSTLQVVRGTGTNGADWMEVVSVPVVNTSNVALSPVRSIVESGIPIPRPRKWLSTREYRAGDFAVYKGAVYEALNTVTGVLPTVVTDWMRVGADDRVTLTSSVYVHGPFAGTTGKPVVPKAYTYTNQGAVVQTFEHRTTDVPVYFDPFVDDVSVLDGARVSTTGQAWTTNGIGVWTIDRDDGGGWVAPPVSGNSQRWFTNSSVTRFAVTFMSNPGTTRLVGIIFRRLDSNNYWICTQTGLYKVVAGAARAAPASGALVWSSFVAGQRMQVSLANDVISVYRNGVLLGSATDPFNNTQGAFGLGAEA